MSVVRAATGAPAEHRSGRSATAVPAVLDPARARALVDVIGPTLRALLADDEVLKVVTFDGAAGQRPSRHPTDGRDFVEGGPLTPDQIVYAGSWPLLLDVPDRVPADDLPALLQARLDEHRAARGELPIVVVIPGLGLFAAGDTWAEANTARHIYLDALRVAEGAHRLGGVRALADAERTFIEAWEAEAYRRDVAAGDADTGRFAGKVALVTGAAQGFGLASPPTSSPRAATSCSPTSTSRSRGRRPRARGALRAGPGDARWP